MDEANVRINATALSVFRSACGCLSEAPVSIVASSRAQLWCVSPQEAVPATLCIFECAAATWFAAWACAATSVDMENYERIQLLLQNQSYGSSVGSHISPTVASSYDNTSGRTLANNNEDTVSVLLSHVPACWLRSIFHSQPPHNAAQHGNLTRVDAALYTVGSSKRNAAAMVPRVLVLGSVSTQFAHCLANVVAEHGGRCGTLPEASVFASLSAVRSEIVSRSVQMPFFTVAPDAGIDRITAQMPVLAETLSLFEGSLYKPCVVLFHAAAIWTTADNPATDTGISLLGSQCVTLTQQSIFFLSLPAHLPNGEQAMARLAQLDSHFCAGARLRLFDLETAIICDDDRTLLLVSRNGCSSAHRRGDDVVLTAPCVVMRVHFASTESRAAFVNALLQQCEKLKHGVVVDTELERSAPKTVLDMGFLHLLEAEVVDIGSSVAVADTDYCTSIESSTRPMWPITFPVFADGFELCEFWKLLSMQTATLLVKLSRVVPKSAHSSLALRLTSCVTDIVGDRWGRAFLIHRAGTVVANFAALETSEQTNVAQKVAGETTSASEGQYFSSAGRAGPPEQRRRDDASLAVQVLRFLAIECCVHIARTAGGDSAHVVAAKESIAGLLRDVEALTLAKPLSTTDRNVPSVRWDKIQEQILLVLVEGALALGSDPDLTLLIVAPFATAARPGSFPSSGIPTAENIAVAKMEASRHAPLADLSRLDQFMSTALASFPASLFCATHPLPALWRLVRPFLIPLLRSFFTRESFDSLFPSTSEDLMLLGAASAFSASALRQQQHRSISVMTEDAEVQTVDSPLWKLLRNSTSAEIESATAGQIYLNRLFGSKNAASGGVPMLRGTQDGISRPAAPLVEDWLQLATMASPHNITASATRQVQMQMQMQMQQQQPNVISPLLSLHRQSSGFGGHNLMGGSDYLVLTPVPSAGIIHTPFGGTPVAGSTPLQATLNNNNNNNNNSAPSASQLQQLERRDMRIGELELKEQSLQATVGALHDELAATRAEVAQLLAERRSFRATLFRERCDFLVDKEVTQRRLIHGQEEVDRSGLHSFLIDRALFESVALMGDAAYRTIPGASTRMPPPPPPQPSSRYY